MEKKFDFADIYLLTIKKTKEQIRRRKHIFSSLFYVYSFKKFDHLFRCSLVKRYNIDMYDFLNYNSANSYWSIITTTNRIFIFLSTFYRASLYTAKLNSSKSYDFVLTIINELPV